jgi:MoxR-like ATPase
LLEKMKVANVAGSDVLLTGPSGTGKTSLAKTYTINTKRPYIAVQMHAEAKESGLLKNVRLKNGEFVEVPLPLLLAYKYGYVAEIKEINLGFAPYLSFLNTLLDRNGSVEVNGEIVHRHPSFFLVCTRNPYSPLYEGTNPMISSTVNRISCMEIGYPEVHEEREALYDCAMSENPELVQGLTKEKAQAMFATMLNFVANIRDALLTPSTKPEVKEILQKRKWTTDIFMDAIKAAKSRADFLQKFIRRMDFSADEFSKIPMRIVSKNSYDLMVMELGKYL